MILYIDTSDTEEICVGIGSKKYKTQAKRDKSQKTLSFINETLKGNNASIDEIKSIKVNTGPGSFTGLRVGVSVANALGWGLGVKVNGRDVSKGEVVEINYGEKEKGK